MIYLEWVRCGTPSFQINYIDDFIVEDIKYRSNLPEQNSFIIKRIVEVYHHEREGLIIDKNYS